MDKLNAGHRKVTHQQIADRLGVSRALVTQALQRTHQFRIGEDTRLEIERVAREMGYEPRNVTTHTIGVLATPSQLSNTADMMSLVFLDEALSERGYRLTIINPELPGRMRLSDVVNRKTVDGVVLTLWNQGRERTLLSPDLSCVLMSEEDGVPDGAIDQIGIDLFGTLKNVFRHLLDRGHCRICLLPGPYTDGFARRVQLAALRAWRELDQPKLNLRLEPVHPSRGGEVIRQVMQSAKPPTAIVCADDYRMMPVFCALQSGGYRIPEDISVIGMLDAPHYGTFEKPITATDAVGPEMAHRVAERVVSRIKTPGLTPARQFVAGEIIDRSTVGPCRA